MPPANSPNSERPQSLLSALRELQSPINADVLNLAATLGTQPDDSLVHLGRDQEQDQDHDYDHDYDHDHDHDHDYDHDYDQLGPDPSRERQHLRLLARQRDEPDHGDRLRRVMSRLSRLSDSSSSHGAAYGDRVPSQNSLYDWSPAVERDAAGDDDELDHILAELRREQPNTHPEILRVLGRSQLDSERERIRSISNRLNQERSGSGSGSAGESLRSTAILQSVRRHPRFSARTREYLQRYNSERDASSRPAQSPYSDGPRLSDTRTSLDRERRDMLSRADSYRRGYLDHRSSASAPTLSPMLQHTVKYLSRIRHVNTAHDGWNLAEDAASLAKDYSCSSSSDFVTDTSSIPPPVETSWLAPGAVLSGCQHATSTTPAVTATAPGTTAPTQHFRILDSTSRAAMAGLPALPGLAPPSRPWLANSYSTSTSRGSQLLSESVPTQTSQQDRWPVKVTIHEVDWHKMSLSATMEAYNVPSHPHSHQSILSTSEPATQQYTRTSSITTYLEGEILDFNHHTLLTESFKSNASNDATYWRKLPPFQKLTDEEVVMALTSKKWFTEVLNKEYILMRWKERCFVKSLARSEPLQQQQPPLPSASTPTFYGTTSANLYRDSHLHSSSSDPFQHTPYRLVRNPSTNVLQVEISTPSSSSHNLVDTEHATFDDSGCGLTISGFYYVCLRRSDGLLEGLYYDPQSSPYQCLRLESRAGGTVGAWGFR